MKINRLLLSIKEKFKGFAAAEICWFLYIREKERQEAPSAGGLQ